MARANRILQLAAVSYKNATGKDFYIKDFLIVGVLDRAPFTPSANVIFEFWEDDRSLKPLTISRNATKNRWAGYQRRSTRSIFFSGVSPYLQRIENRDFIIRHANHLIIIDSTPTNDSCKKWTSKILCRHYEKINTNNIKYGNRTDKVNSVQRSGIVYSEVHMGCGESRVHYLVDALESAPEKSLILIEEPEASLHPSAEYEFGKFLMDICIRKRHQVFLTTHSEFILGALPQASRIYLDLYTDELKITAGLTAKQIKSLLSQGHSKALTILVEDKYAKAILGEIIRRVDPQFLSVIDICIGGDENRIAQTVRTLKDSKISVAAVKDGDKQGSLRENIFNLPGSEPPEKEIFKHRIIKEYISNTYGISLDDFRTTLMGVDHHEWIQRLARRVDIDENILLGEVARIYACGIAEADAVTLTKLLKEASQ